MNGGEVSLLTLTVDHDGAQDCECNIVRTNGLFGGKFGSSIRIMWYWKIILSKLVICIGAGLRRDRRNENEMLRAAPGYRSGERRRRTMIDVVINAIIGIFVGYTSEMHNGIALR